MFFFLFAFSFYVRGQEKVTFLASDGLTITADLYITNKDNPYILLFHQGGYSRGEYKETAKKLIKLGYNCLAVDLRSGEEVNFIQNETAILAKKSGFPNSLPETEKDILATIDYAYHRSNKRLVLFGSSFSASLCLKLAKNNPNVKAVVAFSPGEFFEPEFSVKEEIKGLMKPVFVASSQREISYIKELLTFVPDENKTIFTPKEGPGLHGSKSLWESSDANNEYWLALMMFFSKIKEY